MDGPLLIHLLTTKGKGYKLAEENPGAYHSVGKFDVEQGSSDIVLSDSYSNFFGSELAGIADQAAEKDNSSTADVAVFISDESVSVLRQLPSSRSNVDDLLMGYALNQRHAISRLGTPFDEYLQFDIARKDLKKYKLYIFLNPYRLHDDEFEAIRKIAQDKSSTIL